MTRKVLIIVNTGTPDSTAVRDVRRYLSEFLNDRHVIDLPWLIRKFLVNVIIVPFRVHKSARKYKKLWTGEGSPLLINLKRLENKLREKLKEECEVIGAMRYGNPSLKKVLEDLNVDSTCSVVVFPLYPQFASSTTGSVNDLTISVLGGLKTIPELKIVKQYYNHPLYLESVIRQVRKFTISEYDHILFSYHGLPMRQIQKIHPEKNCYSCGCSSELPAGCDFCYRATCYDTTRLLAGRLQLHHDKYSTSFQSRLSNNWLSPFTDSMVKELAGKGCRKVLAVAPSFTADCLETISEIGEEYKSLFRSHGGDQLDLVPGLNYDEGWAEAIIKIAGL